MKRTSTRRLRRPVLRHHLDSIQNVSSRLDPTWKVTSSIQTFNGDRCVDFFVRLDGTFGFEEFRRDPEDLGAWTPLHYLSDREFSSQDETLEAAKKLVPWFAQLSDERRL